MSVVVKDLDIWKKEVSLWELLNILVEKQEIIEDNNFNKVLSDSNIYDTVWMDHYNTFMTKKLWK